MTIKELHEIRDRMKKELYKRDATGKTIQISVGMGFSGIGAGAKDVYKRFAKLLDEQNLSDHVMLRQTDAMGFPGKEPTVEVVGKDKRHVIYGNVQPQDADVIIEEHVVGGSPVSALVISQ